MEQEELINNLNEIIDIPNMDERQEKALIKIIISLITLIFALIYNLYN